MRGWGRLFALTLILAIGGRAGMAAEGPPSEQRLEKLEATVEQLQEQNRQLLEIVRQLQQRVEQQPGVAASPSASTLQSPQAEGRAVTSTEDEKEGRGGLLGDKDVRFHWKNGLRFESGDGKSFKGKLGGRIHYDMAAMNPDTAVTAVTGDNPSGAELRRVRFYTSGEINAGAKAYYKMQMDFAGAGFKFADVYMGMKDLPVVGKVQLGQFYEPFSLEQLTSDNYITFIERSLPIEAFSPARNVGVLLGNDLLDERMTWHAGVFVDDPNDKGDIDSFDSNTHLTGRLTGLPWWDEESEGRRYLHLGVAGTFREELGNLARYRSRPEVHLAPRYVDTGVFPATQSAVGGAEFLLNLGSFSLQGEYMRNWVDAIAAPNLTFDGYYLSGSWILTGEHRPYKRSAGSVDRLKPLKNFSLGGDGLGAWEVALRYSRLDLDDHAVAGGKLTDYTAGLNWYINPNARTLFNYVLSDLDRGGLEGTSHAFLTRFQIDF